MTDEEARYRLSGDYSDIKEKYISLRRIHTELHVKYKKVEDENKELKSIVEEIDKPIELPKNAVTNTYVRASKYETLMIKADRYLYKLLNAEKEIVGLRLQIKQLENDRRSAVVDKTT